MTSPRWRTVALTLAVIVAGTLAVALVAHALPRPLNVDEGTGLVTGADIATAGTTITPFRAEYRRWNAVLGIPISSAEGVVVAERRAPDILEVTFDLSDFGQDRMSLDGRSLVMRERSFGAAGGPGQTFRRDGDAIHATVRAADGSTRDLRFEYPVAVFEPSVLELPLALLDLRPGDAGHLAWSNFGDEADHWAPYRVLSTERLRAADRTFDARVVRVEFPDGRQRDYWIAQEPPYKIRMVSYNRGRLMTNGWELSSLEIRD